MEKQIHIVINTHEGKMYDEICDYIVVKAPDGEFAIFPNHINVVTSFENGFIKMVRDKTEIFICLASVALEFHDNEVTVLAQEAQAGETKESALEHFNANRLDRLNKNRKQTTDVVVNEKEIIDNIKKSKAGNL